jgi:hypothetical protein
MTPLPTLGGSNGQANMMNSQGVAVGSAQNATPDKACPAPQVLHFKPVIWESDQIQTPDVPRRPRRSCLRDQRQR